MDRAALGRWPYPFLLLLRRRGPVGCLCLIIRPDREPVIVDVGEANAIDAMIGSFQINISGERRGVKLPGSAEDPAKVLEALFRALVQPLMEHLKGCAEWFFAPDGAISQIPFEVLSRDGVPLLEQDETRLFTSPPE